MITWLPQNDVEELVDKMVEHWQNRYPDMGYDTCKTAVEELLAQIDDYGFEIHKRHRRVM